MSSTNQFTQRALLSPSDPGYGSNWASCLARGQIRRVLGASVIGAVKDANPEIFE